MLNRRSFSILLIATAAASAPAWAAPAEPPRPNILFCIADDISYPHMGAYGTAWVRTPGFDRVAREGLLFTRAYTPNAKCAPSRSCILTGRNSWQLEAAANHVCYFPAKFKTYAEALAEHGYFVGHTAKGWGPGEAGEIDGRPRQLTGQPFNGHRLNPPAKGISPADYAANFRDFLAARPADQPFCFWYGGQEPHRGYERGASRRAGKQPTDIAEVPAFWPDNETVRTDMLDYAMEIEHFDSHLVKMLAALEEAGELENTLVLVTADNGMPFPRCKGQAYEYSNHMPLAIMWKVGIKRPGRKVDDYVSFIDFAPTFIELAGLDAARAGMQPCAGRSLTDIFRSEAAGRTNPARDHVLIGQERHDVGRPHDVGYPIRGIVRDGVLYLRNYEPSRWPACNPETGYLNTDGSPTKTLCLEARTQPGMQQFWQWSFGKRGAEELYNLDDDPVCLKNLADDPRSAELKNRLAAEMTAELKAQDDPRMFGRGHVFDEYPYADEGQRGFYERYMAGEKLTAGWVSPSDFEKAPLEESTAMTAEAREFLKTYETKLSELGKSSSLAAWQAACTGRQEDFAAAAAADLAVRKFHSNPAAYRKVRAYAALDDLEPLERRALELAALDYRANQLPPELLERLVALSTEIDRTFKTFRGELGGAQHSNNELLKMLGDETNSAQRQAIWEALKQVGGAVDDKLVELARVRNEAARHLGFDNYWQMQIRLQEHDPAQLLAIFAELDELTRKPFAEEKAAIDAELAARFGVKAAEMMPWHYDNPFFQAAPPSAAVDLDVFYEKKPKEEIVEIARRFFADVDLPAESVLARSDLYERPGKDQHAFSTNIDRVGDVRILCNVKPTAEWMDTTLHELGHAVYDLHINPEMPFNVRNPAHIFTTEGVAMLMGALTKEPGWMIVYAGAAAEQAEKLAPAIRQQRRRDQLLFARWTLVMLHFEKTFYENPERDLNRLWWEIAERYQSLRRPPERNAPDWASKPHFTIAPVYYHNYMLGEVFAAQLRHAMQGLAGRSAQGRFEARPALGEWLKTKVFAPGARQPWPAFVKEATGEALTARYFAAEVSRP